MQHQNALLAARNHELEEQLAVIMKQKSHKRKWIQQGSTMKYETAAAQIAAEASAAPQQSEKPCGGSSQEPAQPALQRCENCGGTGHNAQTYKKDVEASSKSDASRSYSYSLLV
jgi:hypothetical protein